MKTLFSTIDSPMQTRFQVVTCEVGVTALSGLGIYNATTKTGFWMAIIGVTILVVVTILTAVLPEDSCWNKPWW